MSLNENNQFQIFKGHRNKFPSEYIYSQIKRKLSLEYTDVEVTLFENWNNDEWAFDNFFVVGENL